MATEETNNKHWYMYKGELFVLGQLVYIY